MKIPAIPHRRFAAWIFLLGWLMPFPAAGQAPTPTVSELSLPELAKDLNFAAPVTVDGMVLFHVRGIESYPAQKRARDIKKRILDLAKDPTVSIDSLRTEEKPISTDILAGDRRILSVTESDARLQEVSRQEFAKVTVVRIKEAIQKFREDRQPEILTQGALHAAIATVIFIAAFFFLRWVYRKVLRTVERRYKARVQALKVDSFELIRAERIWGILIGFLKVVHLLLFLALIYAYLEFVLSRFPWTRPLAAHFFELILDPLKTMGLGIIDYLPNLAFLGILILVTIYALKIIRIFFTGIEQGAIHISGFDRDWAWPTFKLIRVLVVAFAVVVAYPYIPGSDSDAFKGVSIFLGVLFSLGSSSAVANIIAGYTMIYRRTFKLGDRIQIGEFTGDVLATRLLTTHLKTIKNEIVVVPNSLVLNNNVVNYSTLARTQGLILHTTVGVGYGASWRQVEAMLLLAAERTPGLLREPPPFILQKSLDTFAVIYELNVYSESAQGMNQKYTALHRNILDLFNEHGVQIMTPAYEGDPEKPKVVPKSQWYAPPAEPNQKEKEKG